MKSSALCEVETLRAQVRDLNEQITELETRLNTLDTIESQSEDEDENELRALWPYCWVLDGYERANTALSNWKTKRSRNELQKHNTSQRARFASTENGGMRAV